MTCAIILAAGKSKRMGSRKLLLPFRGKTVIESTTDPFLLAGIQKVIVVIWPGDAEIRAALAGRPVTFAENETAGGDMLSSVRCGVRALSNEATVILVSPADQPALTPGVISGMLQEFQDSSAKLMVPLYRGKRGHPLMFRAELCPEILQSFEEEGLRGLLRAHAGDLHEWPCADAAVIQDIDTPEDYRRAIGNQGAGAATGPTV